MRVAWVVVAWTVAAGAGRARAESAPSADAMASYQQQEIGVRHLVYPLRDGSSADDQGHVRYDGRWDAFQGADHHPLDDAAFFRLVGRDDLLTRYQRWSTVKRAVGAGGWVLVVGGAMAVTIGALGGGGQPVDTGTTSSSRRSVELTGLALIGGGIVSLLVSHFIDPTPVGADEADRLARDYDQSLRGRLGLTDTAADR